MITKIILLNFDMAFTTIFNKEKNISILEHFLSCYLEIPYQEIKGHLKLLNRNLVKSNKKEAKKEIDLLLDYQGKKINIELSNWASEGVIHRNEVYACKIHSRQLKRGDKKYQNIKEIIQINLNNFRCNEKDIKEEYYMRSKEGRYLTKKLRIDMVDMELGRKKCYTASETILSKWCKLFTTEDIEEIKRLGEELMSKESNEKLVEEIREFSDDDENIALYTDLPRSEMEKNTIIYEAEERGFSRGKEEGIEQNNLEIAKKMLQKDYSLEQVKEITGLTETELNQLED